VRRTNVNNYKDILKSKNTIFIITLIAGIGLLTGLVLHQEKIQAGAELLQVYSGLIYHGPRLVKELVQAIK